MAVPLEPREPDIIMGVFWVTFFVEITSLYLNMLSDN